MQEEGREQQAYGQLGVFYGAAWQAAALTPQVERGVPERAEARAREDCELRRSGRVEIDKLIQHVSIAQLRIYEYRADKVPNSLVGKDKWLI